MTQPSLAALETHLWPPERQRRNVWMIADGARDRRVFSTLISSYLNYWCLYSGKLAPELEMAAPYLVQLDYDDREARRFASQAWGKSWGVYLQCDTAMRDLRRHLRRFLVANDWRGRRLVFRYYDPRVLRMYLPTCTREELDTLFGPIECFWAEAETPDALLRFRRSPEGLRCDSLPVAAPAGG